MRNRFYGLVDQHDFCIDRQDKSLGYRGHANIYILNREIPDMTH